MGPRICFSCRRLNPSLAAYCWFDGTPLAPETGGPHDLASQLFPTPFVFPSGRQCRSFAELARACRQNWVEARSLLGDRGFRPFLAALGRADLAQAAERAAAHPDPDLGLDDFLARLPGSQPSPPRLEIDSDEIDLGSAAVGEDRNITLTIRNAGERLLAGVVRSECCLWLGVDASGLNEKWFKATAREQLHLALHVRGKHLRAGTGPQVGEVAIDSNGGVRRVQVRIRVPVTPFPDGVLAGALTPGQLAEKARTDLAEMARLLEDGSVARWYRANSWTYPIADPAATGLAAVQQYFEALGLTPPTVIQVQQGRNTRPSSRPPTEPQLPPLPSWPPQGSGQAPVPPAAVMADSVQGRSSWALVLALLLLAGALAGAGALAWIDRENGSDPPDGLLAGRNAPQAGTLPTQPATPATEDPAPPPATKNAPEGEPVNPSLRDLIRQLNDPDLESNRKAIEGLSALDDAEARRAVPALIGAAGRHDDEEFRQRAARELQRLGPPRKEDVACLADALRIPHPALRRYVVSALKEMGEQARAAGGVLAEALKQRDPELRREAVAILKSLGPAARVLAFRPLLKPAGDTDLQAVRGALTALLELGPLTSEEIDPPMEALGDSERQTWVRCFAADLLGEAGPRAGRAVPVLLGVLQDNSSAVLRARSLQALGRIGDKRPEVLAALLTAATSDREEKIRVESLQLLKRLDPSVFTTARVLELWIAEKGSSVRPALADLLGARLATLKPEEMTELRPLLRHKDPEIVRVGLKVVGDRKADAAAVAAEVAALLDHDDAGVRAAALGALQAIGPAAAKVLPNLSQLLLDRWVAAKDPGVREALAKTLAAHLARLKSEEMTELLPLLRHKDSALVQVGLKVVQDRKADAAALAAEVAALLEHDDAAVRGAAAAALEALGPAASKALPGLTRLLLDRRAAEKDPAVRKALAGLLDTRLAALKPEEMTELRPLLRHKDPALVQVGLKIVGERKGDAATVADEVAALLEHDDGGVRKAALADLEALGPAARKALPRLYEILDNTPKHERTSLALTASRIVDFKDAESMRRLVPHLVAGLHPASLQNKGWKTEAAIDEVLLKIGQPAVEAIFAVLNPETRGKDEINYRKNLYDALAGLGPRCRSEDNYQRLRELRNREIAKKYTDVIEAAGRAVAAMAPE